MISRWVNIYRHWRAGGVSGARRFLNESEHNHVHVFSTNPPVVYLWWGRDDDVLHRLLKDQDLLLLYLFPWTFPQERLAETSATVRRQLKQYSRHRIAFLCNEEYSVELLHKEGLQALFVNQNAFVDERQFRPMEQVPKTHDAVYSASLSPYKRHLLAKEIESLIIMSYTYEGTSDDVYQKAVRAELKHAWWAKDSEEACEKWSTAQLVEVYNRAHVGLCLSSVEGSMFVSMEYLLCGLPIVSTRSVGGRDAFWDDRVVTVCEESSVAVAAAVRSKISMSLPPDEVRALTLEKVEQHRERFRAFLRPFCEPEIPWPQGSHGPTSWYSLPKLGRQLLEGVSLSALP